MMFFGLNNKRYIKIGQKMTNNILYSMRKRVSASELVRLGIAGYMRKFEIDFSSSSDKKKAIFAHDAIGRYINLFGCFEKDE